MTTPDREPAEPILSTAALQTDGLDDTPVPRKRVISWALWDWATQPFNSVILTFVFVSLYLVSDAFLPPEVAAQNADGTLVCANAADAATEYCRGLSDLSAWYGWVTFAAGIVILVLAPVLGQQADARGSKKRWVVGATAVLALFQFGLFFVYSEPSFFWLGAILVALGSVASEIAGVNYNGMLVEVSNRRTIGRVSGLGWGLGYIGGILALVIAVFPQVLTWAAGVFGVAVPTNLVFFIAIALLFLVSLQYGAELTRIEAKLRELAEQSAFQDDRIRELERRASQSEADGEE